MVFDQACKEEPDLEWEGLDGGREGVLGLEDGDALGEGTTRREGVLLRLDSLGLDASLGGLLLIEFGAEFDSSFAMLVTK